MKQITITINGKKLRANQGEPLLKVSRRNDIPIPTLCHLDGVEPYGACRLCTVKINTDDRAKFVTACNYPVRQDLEVETDSKEVHDIRRMVIEALWSRCPGVKALAALAKQYGVTQKRFPAQNPEERCILCGLCVRVCDEVVGANALGFVGRGPDRRVGTPFMAHPDACIGCGACAHVCPTNCISMEKRALQRLRDRWGEKRPCRYALMGLLPGALCANNYECWRCETEQTLMDLCQPVHPVFVARGVNTPKVRTVARKLARMLATRPVQTREEQK
jgi:heterodisulfide reductase subunit A